MSRHRDRPHPRPAAPVRNAKRLVQIQMTNIRPDLSRPTQSHLGVHIRAVHVHLAAVLVHDLANVTNFGLEDAMRGGIRHHQRRQSVAMLPPSHSNRRYRHCRRVAGDQDDPQPRHRRAGGIGAMRRGRDQADVALPVAARSCQRADHQQARIFALRAGVGLQ